MISNIPFRYSKNLQSIFDDEIRKKNADITHFAYHTTDYEFMLIYKYNQDIHFYILQHKKISS